MDQSQTVDILSSLPKDFEQLKKLLPPDSDIKSLENEFNKAYVFQKITKFALEKQLHR